MKTIKIFIASSNELKDERVLMASLANELSTRLEKVGIQVIAVEWESLDSSMNEEHKQEEYNEKLRECDMCMVLYWTKFGMYTKTELDTAYKDKIEGKNPQKVWVYFKEIDDPSKQPTEELKAFRDSFPTKYGHFYSPFANFDTLKAHFLLQFMEYQSQTLEGKSIVKVKDGKVTIDGKEYVDLQNVPFAGNNEEYNATKKSISDKQNLLQFVPTDNPLYSQTAEELRQLQEKLSKMESSLWDTALMITRLCTTKCSERLQRAMDLFNQGDNKGAQAILNEEEIEKDIQHNLNLIKLGEEGKKGLKTNIDEYLLKIQTYENEMSEGWLQKRCELCDRIIELSKSLYGENAEETAYAYNRSGNAHRIIGNYIKALEYYQITLTIREKVLGTENRDTASSYNNVGNIYHSLGDYDQSLKYLQKALAIRKKLLGIKHPDTARAYNNIGNLYGDIGDYDKCLKYHQKALAIRKKVLDSENPEIAGSYFNLGKLYRILGDSDQALKFHQKALKIEERMLGSEHLYTVESYYSIGSLYEDLGDYEQALNYFQRTMAISKKLFGSEHPKTASLFNTLAWTLHLTGRFDDALPWAQKAVKAFPEDTNSIDTLASVYQDLHRYDEALEQFELCLKLKQEQNESDDNIHKTEEKIATLKALMKQQ